MTYTKIVKQLVQEVIIKTRIIGFEVDISIDGKWAPGHSIEWDRYVVMGSIKFHYVKSGEIVNEFLKKIFHLARCQIFVDFANYPVAWKTVFSMNQIKSIELSKVKMKEKFLFRDLLAFFRNVTYINIHLAASEVVIPITTGDWLVKWNRSSLIQHFELHNVPLEVSFGALYHFRKNKCASNASVHIYISTTKGRQKASKEAVKRKWDAFLKMRRLTPEMAGFTVSYEREFILDDITHYDKILTYAAKLGSPENTMNMDDIDYKKKELKIDQL